MKFDVAIVGGGLGGYPAAVNLAREGYNVVLFEEKYLGGECTNYGCVPSKALYHVGEANHFLEKIGLKTNIDWGKVIGWVREIVSTTRGGLEELLERYGVKIVYGKAKFKENSVIVVDNNEYRYDKLLLALGTDPKPLPTMDFDGKYILSNRDIFFLEEEFTDLLVIGGGVIGVEIANMYSDLGVNITIVEALDHILPFLDRDVALALKRYLLEKGIRIYEKTLVEKIDIIEGRVKARLSNNEILEVDKVLVAIGRTPKTRGIGLENIGVKLDKQGYIQVDEYCRVTGFNNVYGAGDVIGAPLLAHKAIVESIVSSMNMMGKDIVRVNIDLIPQTIFSGLEIASIGYTEKDLREKNIRFKRVKLPIYYLSSIRIKDSRYSFIKILVDEANVDKIYGIHIVAPNASEAIAAFIPFYLAKINFREARLIPYPHLTVSEVVREIAEYILGEPVNVFVKK